MIEFFQLHIIRLFLSLKEYIGTPLHDKDCETVFTLSKTNEKKPMKNEKQLSSEYKEGLRRGKKLTNEELRKEPDYLIVAELGYTPLILDKITEEHKSILEHAILRVIKHTKFGIFSKIAENTSGEGNRIRIFETDEEIPEYLAQAIALKKGKQSIEPCDIEKAKALQKNIEVKTREHLIEQHILVPELHSEAMSTLTSSYEP